MSVQAARIRRIYACGLGYVASLEALLRALWLFLLALLLALSLLIPLLSWRYRLVMFHLLRAQQTGSR